MKYENSCKMLLSALTFMEYVTYIFIFKKLGQIVLYRTMYCHIFDLFSLYVQHLYFKRTMKEQN